jgi:hypothetical protein
MSSLLWEPDILNRPRGHRLVIPFPDEFVPDCYRHVINQHSDRDTPEKIQKADVYYICTVVTRLYTFINSGNPQSAASRLNLNVQS